MFEVLYKNNFSVPLYPNLPYFVSACVRFAEAVAGLCYIYRQKGPSDSLDTDSYVGGLAGCH
jgi:hypothetical protein